MHIRDDSDLRYLAVVEVVRSGWILDILKVRR